MIERTIQKSLPGEFKEINQVSLEMEKRAILSRFFTNVGGDIRAIRTNNMPDVIAAALVARFSRANEPDATELFWSEFISDPELGTTLGKDRSNSEGSIDDLLAGDHAKRMIRRILDQFGDDSVREDASGYIVAMNMPVLTAVETFQNPLVVGIEASTRYIEWGEKDTITGEYKYMRPKAILNSPFAEMYVETADKLFDAYGQLWQPVWDFVVTKNPRPADVSEAAYNSAIRGRVCDNLRKLLPLGIQTNFGLHANYRTFSDLSMSLAASHLPESRDLGRQIAKELLEVNPEFIAVALSDRGEASVESKIKMDRAISSFSSGIVYHAPSTSGANMRVDIMDEKPILSLVTKFILHELPGLDFETALEIAKEKIKAGEHKNLFQEIGEARTNRRHKVPEIFNALAVRYTYEGISFSGYKDLNRHRKILYKTPADFSANKGFYIPSEIEEMRGEVLRKYSEAQHAAINAYHEMFPLLGVEARKILTHGTRTTFSITMGLAESYWIDELRSIASGDPEYRWFAQQAALSRRVLLPDLAMMKTFVDYNDCPLNRIKEAVRADLRGVS